MAYRISQKAEEDIIKLYVDGAGTFGVQQAEAYHAGLEAAFTFIGDHPRAARERLEIEPPVRVHPYKSHVIIYLIEGRDILILRVRHSREDWINHLEI